jgi:hypothetical protein
MQTITTAGLDIAKSVFQVHGADALPPVAPWGGGSVRWPTEDIRCGATVVYF